MTNLNSKIEWTDATWNPTSGCDKVSPGCDNCYAEAITERFHGKGSFSDVKLHEDRLDIPLKWRKPRRVFVNSMSDLFHDSVPDEFIARVWAVMAATPDYTYQILTKRHGRMRSLLSSPEFRTDVNGRYGWIIDRDGMDVVPDRPWPLSNIWGGVSVEDQKRADLRIPALMDTPLAVRFLSCEPLIGPVNLTGRGWLPVSENDPDPDAECVTCGTEEFSDQRGHPVVHRCGSRHSDPCEVDPKGDCRLEGAEAGAWCDGPIRSYPRIDWCIVGGESGRHARPMSLEWVSSLVSQCREAKVSCFVK